jgi:hypothetical protein
MENKNNLIKNLKDSIKNNNDDEVYKICKKMMENGIELEEASLNSSDLDYVTKVLLVNNFPN